jgi:hypothetical protein
MNALTDASVSGNDMLFQGSSGRWAGEQLLAALQNGQHLSPQVLRTNGVLRRDEWIAYDTELIEGAVARTQAVADLVSRGLTKPLANSMGKTVLNYDKFGDLADATVSMDGMARTENDRPNYTPGQLPIPITHKDWRIHLRVLEASRNPGGEPLDTTMTRLVGRKIAEQREKMLILGNKQFIGLPIYGYMTHPQRITSGFGANGDWEQTAKTGDNYLTDVMTMVSALAAQKHYGPFMLYVTGAASIRLDADFKANGTDTVRDRILKVNGISGIGVLDFLPLSNVLMVSMTRETAVMVQGEPLQTVQWDVNGGFAVDFKGFEIQVPLVRAAAGNSGIYHMSD